MSHRGFSYGEDKELVQNILRDNKVVRNARQQHELDELQAIPQIALPWTPEGKGSLDAADTSAKKREDWLVQTQQPISR